MPSGLMTFALCATAMSGKEEVAIKKTRTGEIVDEGGRFKQNQGDRT